MDSSLINVCYFLVHSSESQFQRVGRRLEVTLVIDQKPGKSVSLGTVHFLYYSTLKHKLKAQNYVKECVSHATIFWEFQTKAILC